MQARFGRLYRHVLVCSILLIGYLVAAPALAAPYAAMVMDARNGEVIFARNHDTKLHPASLTKMMTLYIAFEAVKHGEVTLDTMFTTSRRATQQTCVCLGLREGQKISLRHLIRAAALRSANDAAVVIAEGISGSVEAFADRMTATARAMGMSNTTFRNPHGLTQSGHVSTARDMTILGRQLYFDYPQYFNIFSRRSDNAGVGTVPNTNRRFLDAYSGADGIKTGYTRAAGFNLTASAQRGGKHIIATMFGGSSTAARNAHVAELLDIGFSRAGARVATRAPATPGYRGRGAVAVAQAPEGSGDRPASARTIRLQTAVRTSPRPQARPERAPSSDVLLALRDGVEAAVSQIADATSAETAPAVDEGSTTMAVAALAPETPSVTPPPRPDDFGATADLTTESETPDFTVAQAAGFSIANTEDLVALDVATAIATPDSDTLVQLAEASADQSDSPDDASDTDATSTDTVEDTQIAQSQNVETLPETVWIGAAESILLADFATPDASTTPAALYDDARAETGQILAQDGLAASPRPPERQGIILTSAAQPVPNSQAAATAAVAEANVQADAEIVSRLSTSDGGRLWGVSLGEFTSRNAAERGIITVKMAEAAALGNGISRIRQTSGRFEASFAGLTATEAERACRRLSARGMDCTIAHP
ncbi:D-alanyl-D-alanine carboxypeptidase family protein [Roseinatronobacter alkalisoli]|uniref:Serine hydrolase n=1 Tax=Roseinatronobacter alkalisoli TaxID=3028235 RepID=A0ABT5TC16_9RHOB|nr:serine hydrolase [Roseinatronobacter sp. HJB301]MDD7972546.1 serine hydrolase [Roseinatronobacter sp. HJB301]